MIVLFWGIYYLQESLLWILQCLKFHEMPQRLVATITFYTSPSFLILFPLFMIFAHRDNFYPHQREVT